MEFFHCNHTLTCLIQGSDIFVNENENKNDKYRQSFTRMRMKTQNYFGNENRILTVNKKQEQNSNKNDN